MLGPWLGGGVWTTAALLVRVAFTSVVMGLVTDTTIVAAAVTLGGAATGGAAAGGVAAG